MRTIYVGLILVAAACTGGKHYTSTGETDAGNGSGSGAGDAGGDAPNVPAEFALTFGNTDADDVYALDTVSDGLIVVGAMPSGGLLGTIFVPGKSLMLAKLDLAGKPVWAKSYGPLSFGDATIDSAGDIVVTGSFAAPLDLGGQTFTPNGSSSDFFIAKFSGADGSHKWSVQYGGPGTENGNATCVDPSGDVYVAGLVYGPTNIGPANIGGPNITNSSNDMFVGKYSGSNGTYVWGQSHGGSMADYARHADCDGSKVVVSGPYTGTTNLGGSDIAPFMYQDMFLAAYSTSNGNHVWSVGHGGSGLEEVNDIEFAGNAVYAVGNYSGTINLGGTTKTNAGDVDMFVAKYDATTGAYGWDKTYGDTQAEVPNAVKAVGANLVVTGEFASKINFGNGDLNSAGSSDAYVATLTQANGSYVDAWRVGGANGDKGKALADLNGSVVLGGRFAGVTIFGSTEATTTGSWDGFVFKRKQQ